MGRVYKCVSVGLQLYRRCKVVIQFFQMPCIHALTLHPIATRTWSRGHLSQAHRAVIRGFRSRERKLIRIKLVRELQVELHLPNRSKASTEASAPTNFLLLLLFHVIAYECLSLGVAWNPFDAWSTSLF